MLRAEPIHRADAFAFIAKHHRHHKPPQGSLFHCAVSDGEKVCGVAVVGRPHDRHQQDGYTACVTRLCTDGTKNACSKLYRMCWRIARELGYTRLITYILKEESGVTLYAAGFRLVGERPGGSWNVKSRPRIDKHPTGVKLLFELT